MLHSSISRLVNETNLGRSQSYILNLSLLIQKVRPGELYGKRFKHPNNDSVWNGVTLKKPLVFNNNVIGKEMIAKTKTNTNDPV